MLSRRLGSFLLRVGLRCSVVWLARTAAVSCSVLHSHKIKALPLVFPLPLPSLSRQQRQEAKLQHHLRRDPTGSDTGAASPDGSATVSDTGEAGAHRGAHHAAPHDRLFPILQPGAPSAETAARTGVHTGSAPSINFAAALGHHHHFAPPPAQQAAHAAAVHGSTAAHAGGQHHTAQVRACDPCIPASVLRFPSSNLDDARKREARASGCYEHYCRAVPTRSHLSSPQDAGRAGSPGKAAAAAVAALGLGAAPAAQPGKDHHHSRFLERRARRERERLSNAHCFSSLHRCAHFSL